MVIQGDFSEDSMHASVYSIPKLLQGFLRVIKDRLGMHPSHLRQVSLLYTQACEEALLGLYEGPRISNEISFI